MVYLSTGSTIFDLALGGGYPCGRIVNPIGDKSTGKTYFASEAIAQARAIYKKNLIWRFNDAERRYSIPAKKVYGFDICPEDQTATETIEEFEVDLSECLRKLTQKQFLIYVLDSFDALSCYAEIQRGDKREKKIKHGTYDGKRDGYQLEKNLNLNEFFRRQKSKIKNHNCLLMIISQVRDNIGVMFGKKYKRTGGKALDHWASQTIWLSEAEKYYKNGNAYGISVKIQVEKNSEGMPFKECFVDIRFDNGVDNVKSNLLYLYDLKTDIGKTKKTVKQKTVKDPETKKATVVETGSLEWDGKDFDLDSLTVYIEQHNQEDVLIKKVKEKWAQAEKEISLEGMQRKSKKDILK